MDKGDPQSSKALIPTNSDSTAYVSCEQYICALQNTLYPILSMLLEYFYFYIFLGTQTQCKMVLDHMERIIKVKAGVLSKEDKNRTEPK